MSEKSNQSAFYLPFTPTAMLVFMKAEDTAKFAGSVKVNFPGLDASHAVRLLNRPEFPMSNPTDHSSTSNPFEGGTTELYSTTVTLFVDKSLTSAIMHCFAGTNLGTFTIWEVGTGGGAPAVVSTRKLSDVFIESFSLEFNENYAVRTSEGLIVSLKLVYPKIEEVRTKYDDTMAATGNIGVSSDRQKDLIEPQ